MVLLYDAFPMDGNEIRTCVRIRGANRRDAARLAELSGVLGYPVSPEHMSARLAPLLDRKTDAVFVAVDGENPIGWIHAGERQLLETPPDAEILGLVVDAAYRRSGVARQLVAEVEAWASARGLDQITVRSNVVRTESHPFYRALGYSHVKTQHTYRKLIARDERSNP
jgi:GNAT superfamily N-acetyltransferase